MPANSPDSWSIDRLPFVWGTSASSTGDPSIPSLLPFELGVDEASGLLVQRPVEAVVSALERAYRQGSVINSNLDDEGQGRRYAESFLAFLYAQFAVSLEGRSALEIGCGNGYLMSRLAPQVQSIVGVEPGPQGQAGAVRFGLDIRHGFFPEAVAGSSFDLILLHSVLEHVQDPVEFLRGLRAFLRPGATIAISVPDCTPYLEHGDVSMLFHEHWSYFDEDSLRGVATLAGMEVRRTEQSGFGGSLYAVLAPAEGEVASDPVRQRRALDRSRAFLRLARRNCGRLRAACLAMLEGERSLGIYVPSRFVNALALFGPCPPRLRFFDDDPALAGQYYPGIPIPVETMRALLLHPTDAVLVMSRTFGPALAERLRRELPASTTVATIADVLDTVPDPSVREQ